MKLTGRGLVGCTLLPAGGTQQLPSFSQYAPESTSSHSNANNPLTHSPSQGREVIWLSSTDSRNGSCGFGGRLECIFIGGLGRGGCDAIETFGFVGFDGSVWFFWLFGMYKSAGILSVCESGCTQHFEPVLHKPFVVKYASQYSAKCSATQTPLRSSEHGLSIEKSANS